MAADDLNLATEEKVQILLYFIDLYKDSSISYEELVAVVVEILLQLWSLKVQ